MYNFVVFKGKFLDLKFIISLTGRVHMLCISLSNLSRLDKAEISPKLCMLPHHVCTPCMMIMK